MSIEMAKTIATLSPSLKRSFVEKQRWEGGYTKGHAMLNFTYININARHGKDDRRFGLTRHVAIELRLVEIPTHRIQHSLQREQVEDGDE